MARNKLIAAGGPRVLGAVFLVLCIVFVWLTYAVFTKKFSNYDEVTLQSSKIGLSMPARADVKIRGVIVGEVLETVTDGDGAKLTLGLYPDKRSTIPSNVTAQILPKTLFGEKYVALQVPADPQSPIKPGATIARADVAIELEEVLNDLFPLLRTVQPAQLNYTLTALSNALEGRGDKIGENLETLDSYLKRMNPEMPGLIDSLIKLGQTSQVYESIVPDLTRLLRNSVKTAGTIEDKQQELKALFTDIAGFSGTAKAFLDKNGENMITLADQGSRILPLLARYAPEYNCFLRGIVSQIPRSEESFRNKTLHIVLETIEKQPRGYNTGDMPQYNDNRGPFPYCNLMYKAMRGGYSQKNLPPLSVASPRINDGVNYPIAKRVPVNDAVGGTAQEKLVIGAAASPVLGVPVDEVPDLATLLLGPLARGMELDVR